jgi:two-component system sensor histidine kinase UhpB
MSLKKKLLIYLNLIILLGFFIALFLSYFQTKENIREDINSSIDLAEFAITSTLSNRKSFDNLTEFAFVKDLNNLKKLHHLKIEVLNTEGEVLSRSSDNLNLKISPPVWFKSLFEFDDKAENFLRIVNVSNTQSNIGSIVIESNLDYDHQIIWIEFLALLEVVFFVVLFINLSILMIFTQTLVPIDNIIDALTKVSSGQFNIKLEKISISEFETIRFHLSKVIHKLKANDKAINLLNQKILDVQEQEKIMISHDLHDHLAQDLASIQIHSRTAQLSNSAKQKNKVFEQIIEISQNINESIRQIIKKMNLSMIDELGFEDALENLIQESLKNLKIKKINCEVKTRLITKKMQTDFYRITQEAISNIKKHSLPTFVKIKLDQDRQSLIFTIENDGVFKITKGHKKNGIGLIGIQQRVKKFNGIFETKNQKNKFTLIIKVPKKNLT